MDFYYLDDLFGSPVSIGGAELDANGVARLRRVPDGRLITAEYAGSSTFESSISNGHDPTTSVTDNGNLTLTLYLPLLNNP